MKLYRRGARGILWYRFVFAGREYRRSTNLTELKAAHRIAEKEHSEIILGIKGALRPVHRFADLVEAYGIKLREDIHPPGYVRMRIQQLSFWSAAFKNGELDLTEIGLETVEAGKRALLEAYRKPGTVNQYLIALSTALNMALAWKWIDHNPMSAGHIRMRPAPPKDRLFSDEEVSTIVSAAPSPLKQCFTLALMTGCRLGELADATWENVDLVDRMFTLHPGQVKTRRARRVPLNSPAVKALMTLPNRARGGRVFASSRSSIGSQFHKLLRRRGIDGASFHTIRHSLISRLHAAGIPVGTVSLLVGHTPKGMTLRYYTHPQLQELREAVQVLETWFEKTCSTAQKTAQGNGSY